MFTARPADLHSARCPVRHISLGEHHKSEGKVVKVPGVMEGFHTFGLLWTPDEYIFYVDGKETWRSKAGGVCQVPQYMLLSDEIGSWAGDITEVMPHSYKHANLRQLSFSEAKDLIRRCLDVFSKELKHFDPKKAIYNFAYNASTPEIANRPSTVKSKNSLPQRRVG
jgi:beta-glucanase (GH16 family)